RPPPPGPGPRAGTPREAIDSSWILLDVPVVSGRPTPLCERNVTSRVRLFARSTRPNRKGSGQSLGQGEVEMRLLALSLALTTLAGPALAMEEKGSWAVDLETTPGQRLGFAYYVSDRFSLRPSLGGGYSSLNGAFANLGLDLRFELRP